MCLSMQYIVIVISSIIIVKWKIFILHAISNDKSWNNRFHKYFDNTPFEQLHFVETNGLKKLWRFYCVCQFSNELLYERHQKQKTILLINSVEFYWTISISNSLKKINAFIHITIKYVEKVKWKKKQKPNKKICCEWDITLYSLTLEIMFIKHE